MVTNIRSAGFLSNSLTDLSKKIDDSIQKLGSGKNDDSKDNPAAKAAISLLTSQISGLAQAAGNINTAVSVTQTAQGALAEGREMLDRMRELALSASNDTLSSADRDAIQTEMTQLQEAFNGIARDTSFGGEKLLDGSFQGREIQVGEQGDNVIRLSISDSSAELGPIDISSTDNATASLQMIDQALADVSSTQADLGVIESRLEAALNVNQTRSTSAQSALSQIQDTDFAKETAELTKGLIQQQASTALLAQQNKTLGNNLLSLLNSL